MEQLATATVLNIFKLCPDFRHNSEGYKWRTDVRTLSRHACNILVFLIKFFAIPSIHLQDHVAVKGFQSGAGFCNHRIQFNLDKRAPCLRVFRSGSHNLNGDVETVL